MRSIGERAAVALGAIAGGHFEPAGIDVGREVLRLQIPGPRHFAQCDAAVAGDHLAVGDPHARRRRPAAARRRYAPRVWRAMREARATAPPPCTIEREPQVDGRVGRVKRVALDDLDPVEIDAEDFVRDLRVGRLVALAVRMGADVNFDLAVGGELDIGLLVAGHDRPAPGGKHGRAVRSLLDEEGQFRRR